MDDSQKIQTLADLKAALDALTPAQLAQPIRYAGEACGGKIDMMWVLAEDHVNPSGDGLEPASAYDAEDVEAETRISAGTVLLLVADPPPRRRTQLVQESHA